MLKLHHGALRRTTGLAIAAAVAGGGMLVAQPAVAQQAKEQEVETIERFHIRKVGEGRVEGREIPSELRAKLANCEGGEKFETEASSAPSDGKKRVAKILVCGKPGASKAEIAAMLEKSLSRIEGTSEIPAENKAEIISKLRARIAELRSGS